MFFQQLTQEVPFGAVVLRGATLALLSYCLAIGIYRLYFHPLAKFPGPFWARVSTLPSYWHTLQRDRHVWLWRLQQEYGSTFRYDPNAVLVNTPEAYRTLLGPKGNLQKSLYYEFWPRSAETVATWNCVDAGVHARKRRILGNAFSADALKSAEPFVLANITRWCELVTQEVENGDDSGWSHSLNLADWANYLVFDILSDLCFGKSFGMKEPDSNLRFVPSLMVDYLLMFHPIAHSPIAALWVWLKPRGLDWLLQFAAPSTLLKWETFVDKCLRERTRVEAELENSEKPDAGRKDFFHYLFHAVDPDTGKRELSLGELYGEAESMIIAGSDTTAIVTSAMFFYLARNPAIQARLAAEVRAAFTHADEICTGARLASCQYLRAFVQETLRMTPPVSAELCRVVAEGGTAAGGHYFPEGVRLSVGLYCLSYDETLFAPDPFRFRPERWIVGEDGVTAESVERAESGFCSFSYGPRSCLGKQLAWMELSIVMARVLFLFEVRRDATKDLGAGDPNGSIGRHVVDQYQTYEAFVSIRDGPLVQFRKRL